MEGMVVSASTGVLSSLLSKLSVLLSDQYKHLKGIKRDIESLNLELTDMNAALVKLADREKLDVQTKAWRDKVREMAYDIEDIIDIFMHHYSQGDDKHGLYQKTARKIKKLRARFQIAGMIQDIKARVEEQSQSRDRYKVEESISQPRVVEVDPRLPAMYEDAKRLVGIDGPREEIIKHLMDEDDSESGRLKVLSIVGFGGLGKTTLANQVFAKIRNEFERTAFVSVSRTPHMPKILKDILSRVGYGGTKEMEDDVPNLVEILRATLTDKRYFVIIDDIWSIKDWHTIECAFVENNNSSRVITTTRIKDVSTACCFSSQGHVYEMQPLNELHSRRLFFKRLFDTQDSCPKQFRDISDQMLKKCKGVPLAITSIASLLANHIHIEIWEKIHNSLGSELDTNPTLEWMRHVLNLSYNDLSHELKTCLLYLGMYPEDYYIKKKALVGKWIAEGFVREKHGLDLEEAAENCFNELINRSMIQPCFEGDFDGVWACKVHDLMLDLIILKCKEENFITIIDNKYPITNATSKVRRISHQFCDRNMPLTAESMSASTVRTYTFFPMVVCMPPLSKFELLRVLDMDLGYSTEGPVCLDLSAINHLFLLRYVKVRGLGIKLPKKFGKLKHLITLDLSRSGLQGHVEQQIDFGSLSSLGLQGHVEQQIDFGSLSSLRHLNLQQRVVFKNELSKLCNLRSLSLFDIGINSIECIRYLGELTNLRNLDVFYKDSFMANGVENNSKMTILAASLNKLGNSNLRHLVFHAWVGARSPSAQFWSDCLTHPRHLQSFCLQNAYMPKVPNWIAHADRLARAILHVQELRSDDVQLFAQLPCLIYLYFTANTIPENSIIIHPNTFHSLKTFSLFWYGLPRLTFEPAAMSQLQRLRIELNACGQGAGQLQQGSPIGGIEHLASLEEISLFIHAKCDQWSNIESACRNAISRHPKSQAIKIDVSGCKYDENGELVSNIRNTAAGTSGVD